MSDIGNYKDNSNNKTIELIRNVINFDDDINKMIDILEQIYKWIDNGVDIGHCVGPLFTQIEQWKNKMNFLFVTCILILACFNS